MQKTKVKKKFLSVLPYIIFLGALVLLFFRDVLSFNSDYIIQGSDLIQTYYQKFIYKQALLGGKLPLWNPYLYCGYPFLAHPYNGTFYPLNLFFLLMPINVAYSWIFVFETFLSGIFMFYLVKYLVWEKWAAFVSAICFMFSGFTATRIWAGHCEVYASSIWIPLIFLLFLKSIKKKSFIYAMFAGLGMAVQFFAGHTQTFFFTVMILFIYFLYDCIIEVLKLQKKTIVRVFKSVLLKARFFAVALVSFTMFSAVQFIPTFELIKLSTRGQGNPFFMSAYGSFPPEHLIRFLIPDFFGNMLKTLYAGNPVTGEIHWEITYYIGVLPLLAALYILFKKINEKIRRIGLLVIGAVLMISGLTRIIFLQLWQIRNNPSAQVSPQLRGIVKFFETVYTSGVPMTRLLPVFLMFMVMAGAMIWMAKRSFAYKVHTTYKNHTLILFFGIICFTGIVLSFGQYAPFGLYYILYKFVPGYRSFKWPARHLIISNFALCVLAGYGMKGLAKHKAAKILIVAIILGDLFLYAGKFLYLKKEDIFYPRKEISNFLRQDSDLFRVLILPVLKPDHVFEPSCLEFQANTCIALGLYNMSGYDPMLLRRYHELTNALQNNRLDDFGNTSIRICDLSKDNLLRLLNVKYIYADKQIEKYKLALSRDNIVKNFSDSCFIGVNGSVKRFFVVHKAIIAGKDEDILNILKQENFQPGSSVILEQWQNPAEIKDSSEVNQGKDVVNVCSYKPEIIDLLVSASGSGYLVIDEVFYPGWRAYLNGKEVDLYRADYAMRAVYLPKAGKYHLELRFIPDSVKKGMCISLLSLLSFFAIILAAIIRRRKFSRKR